MAEFLITNYKKYKQVILYLFFGGVTTVQNILTYYIFTHLLGINNMVSNIIAWVLSVLIAYITNKVYVFESKSTGRRHLIKEMSLFFYYRLLSGLIDLSIMFVFVNVLHYNDIVIKIISNVVVIIANFVFSKLLIFKK